MKDTSHPALTSIAISFVRTISGLGTPDSCQHDEIKIDKPIELPDNMQKIRFTYTFDEDCFSQYDKTIEFSGEIKLNINLEIMESNITAKHIGVAAQYKQIRP